MTKIELREYEDETGNSPFSKWFNNLDTKAALKVNTYITRVGTGNLSNVKPVGNGVSELKINWASGYRVYFGQDGEELILLLAGGTKKRQQNDIQTAKERWLNYKQRKK